LDDSHGVPRRRQPRGIQAVGWSIAGRLDQGPDRVQGRAGLALVGRPGESRQDASKPGRLVTRGTLARDIPWQGPSLFLEPACCQVEILLARSNFRGLIFQAEELGKPDARIDALAKA